MTSLPLLRERQDELSKCAFCPKLCRATCVVSEQEPREAITPWGKMTSAFEAGRGGRVDAERSELAWACSNCFRCREACDHRNPVSETLNDARADYADHGLAPRGIRELLARLEQIEVEHVAAVERLLEEPGVDEGAGSALLLGCRYAGVLTEEARAAVRLTVALVGPVRLLRGCCGAWQRAAGARAAADRARVHLCEEAARAERLLVLDPRCALELRGATKVTTLVELAARHPERFGEARGSERFRYHDACALGRGLGLYDEPRRLLQRLTGAAPAELKSSRNLARCSGAGGLLPISMPEIAAGAARRLLDEHAELGGGALVTTCASSLSLLRAQGGNALDLITVLERGLLRDE